MSDEPSPRPWMFCPVYRAAEKTPGALENSIIVDAEGGNVAILSWSSKGTDHANGRLIVDAVNERERLRDIVRNAVETLNQVYKHADMTDALREVVAETQRETRAAIGEDAP